MALCTFKEGFNKRNTFILRPGCKNENSGYFSNVRVDRSTLPEGWYAYDIREDGNGNLCSIEKGYVIVNHGITFLTQTPVRFPKDKNGKERDWMLLAGRGGWSFS
jgi:hypothetical protein